MLSIRHTPLSLILLSGGLCRCLFSMLKVYFPNLKTNLNGNENSLKEFVIIYHISFILALNVMAE
jgi:hypothetical protein